MSFYDKVYEAVMTVPKGRVATYGQIAVMCGSPHASRAVGYALHCNPRPGVIPCHRIVNREGRLAPAFAFGGMLLYFADLIIRRLGYDFKRVCGVADGRTGGFWRRGE